MYRFFFIAKNNIKKQKNDMITFFLMTMITSLLLFLSLSYMVDIGGVIDNVHEKINGADLMFFVSKEQATKNKTEEAIIGNPYTAGYEITERLYSGTSKYGHKNDKDLTEYPIIFVSYDQDIDIHRISVDTKKFSGNDIVLPIRMSTDFQIGDIIKIKVSDNEYNFKVVGYAEDSIYCSPMNMGAYLVYVSDGIYNDLKFENPYSIAVEDIHKVKLSKEVYKKKIDPNDICDEIFNEINDWIISRRAVDPDFHGLVSNYVPYSMLHNSAMILPLMFIAIVFVFALIIFIIAMVIIHFSVKNFIMTNMKNTAIMEAAGYTVGEMIMILLVQLVSVAFLGSLAGAGIGAALIDKISVIILITLGLPWNQPVNVLVLILTILGLCVLIGVLTLVIGREYNKTTVFDALRGGINAHNFKRNYFPFESSVFPVAITLSLKETFGRFRNQIGVFIISILLTASTLLGLGTADTFSDDDTVVNMAGVDYADVSVEGDMSMGANIDNLACVDYEYGEEWQSLNYSSKKVRKEWSCSTRSFTDTSQVKGLAVVEGRMPVHRNEIMFATNAASKLKVGTGDTVNVRNGDSEETFLVTGLCQVLNNMGYMAYMTIDGLERINYTPDDLSYTIFLKKGYDINDFEKEFREIYPDVDIMDFRESVQSIIGVVKLGIKAVAIVIAVVTMLVVAFVESLVIRTQINRSWRNLGVSKALGYTSSQLIVQTMLSNMPAIILGMIPGFIFASVFGEKIMTLMFSIFGFKKSDFFINPSSYLVSVVIIAGIALFTSAVTGRKIKILEPVKMITEE